jgi:hypothetical protein
MLNCVATCRVLCCNILPDAILCWNTDCSVTTVLYGVATWYPALQHEAEAASTTR